MQFLGKLWKMLENVEILNLSKHKEDEIIWCQNQIIIPQSFSQIICYQRNEKKLLKYT